MLRSEAASVHWLCVYCFRSPGQFQRMLPYAALRQSATQHNRSAALLEGSIDGSGAVFCQIPTINLTHSAVTARTNQRCLRFAAYCRQYETLRLSGSNTAECLRAAQGRSRGSVSLPRYAEASADGKRDRETITAACVDILNLRLRGLVTTDWCSSIRDFFGRSCPSRSTCKKADR